MKKKYTIIDRVLELSNSPSTHLTALVDKYGKDIVLTSFVFSHQAFDDMRIEESTIDQTKALFELVDETISSAHEAYIDTQQGSESPLPDVRSALYESGLETWHEYNAPEHLQWIHEPPEEPEMIHFENEEEAYHVWLSAQRAISAYTRPITLRDNASTVKRSLTRLTNTIINYNDVEYFLPDVHYYATRVLLSLLAPSAASFAEECWVRLHYGEETEWAQEGPELEEGDSARVEELIKEHEQITGRHNLPRRGQPETLQSIFDQPFPLLRDRKS